MSVKRLSNISNGTDIHELKSCIYPGGHCPLFGVHLTLGNIVGVTMLVVGTADCGFYTYKTMHNFAATLKQGASIRCAVLEETDVIKGCETGLKKAIHQLDKDPETRLIVVVTSCVIELIGDDIKGIVHGVQAQCSTPISVIKTENFKTVDYTQGVEMAMESVTRLLSPAPKLARSFSVLGPRFQGVCENGIIQKLIQDGYTMVTEFPCNCDLKAVQDIPKSSFAILTDKTALTLARSLESRFQLPFADLSPSPIWADVAAGHDALSKITGTSYARDLEKAEEKINQMRDQLIPFYKGKKFIIGNLSGSPFAAACLIAEIGGEIELILAGNIYEKDRKTVARLLELGQDPLVAKNANITALKTLAPQFKADFHIGMGWSGILDKGKTRSIPARNMTPWIGTDYQEKFYGSLLADATKEKEIRS